MHSETPPPVMTVPASTTLACNPANGEVTWQVPFVAATTGITGKPLEAVFQVANTPAVNEVPIEEVIKVLIGTGVGRMEAMKTVARERGLSKREVYKLMSGPAGPKAKPGETGRN